MNSVYVRELKSGEKINVHMAVEDSGDRFNVYMSNESLWLHEDSDSKTEIGGDVAHTLTEFLEDDEKREQFNEGMTFGIAIKKGAESLGTDPS